MRGWILVLCAAAHAVAACARVDATGTHTTAHPSEVVASAPAQSAAPDRPPPAPACDEAGDGGAWPRAATIARVARGHGGPGWIEQTLAPGGATRLRFLGTHVFDLLDKVVSEGGPEPDRRRVICTALEACAASGAPVVRIWGSLKRTGDSAEVEAAADALELVLDENARRARPLRFVIALLNHQPGYGTPRPERSLDDQDPASGWAARQIYLEGGWRAEGRGLLAERIRRFAARPAIRASREVIAWELVNELDTFKVVSGPLAGADGARLRDGFLVPALELGVESFPQPAAFGEIRALPGPDYMAFARGLTAALTPTARARLVWTSHVYAPKGGDPAKATAKLDLDLGFASESGMPFLLGEIGQLVPGAAPRFCADGARHDIDALFTSVLGPKPRDAIDAAIFWGEGRCRLEVRHPDRVQTLGIGAGGDSADLGPNETAARAAVTALRRSPRFQIARAP